MPLINCEINLILTWSRKIVITETLSAPDNAKLLQQLKSGFKRTIIWNKYQSSIKTYAQNRYLNHLVDPGFKGVNRFLVLSLENEKDRILHSTYYLPKVEIKYYNVMIDGKNFFGSTNR